MARMVSFAVLIIFIAFIGFMFYRVMSTFLLPIFLAALLVVIFHPLHKWITKRCGQRPRLSAVFTTAAVLGIVMLPTLWSASFAIVEGVSLLGRSDVGTLSTKISNLRRGFGLEMRHGEKIRSVEGLLNQLSSDTKEDNADAVLKMVVSQSNELKRTIQKTGEAYPAEEFGQFAKALKQIDLQQVDYVKRESSIQVAMHAFREFKVQLLGGSLKAWLCELVNPSPEQIRKLSATALKWSKSQLLSLGGATGKFLGQLIIGLAIMTVTLYFFLVDGPGMLQTVQRLSPLDDRYEAELLLEFDKISRAVVLATLLSAIAQGVLAGIGFAIAGVGSVFLLTLLTTVLAMVPFVGAAAVWVPCCLWLIFSEGRVFAGILLAVYGTGIVSTIDNVIKPLVLHGQSRLHPLLALLSVLGGVQALGPIGILVGPMVVVFLQTSLNILQRELSQMENGELEPAQQGADDQGDESEEGEEREESEEGEDEGQDESDEAGQEEE